MGLSNAEGIGTVVLFLLILSIFDTGWSGDNRSSEKHLGRQKMQSSLKSKVAWGQRRSAEDVMTKPSESLEGEKEAGAYREGEVLVDSSWSISAFRAFHEMRAGRPPSASGGDDELLGSPGTSRHAASWLRRPFQAAFEERASSSKDGDKGGGGSYGQTRLRDEACTSGDEANPDTVALAAPASSRPIRPTCWHLRGRLTNAVTGQTIALVEGVELTRSLAFETAPRKREGREVQDMDEEKRDSATEEGTNSVSANLSPRETAEEGEDLEVDRTLKSVAWKAFGALASSKFFMYQDPQTREPMEFFRNTPVEKKQTVRTYERFSQVISHLLKPNGKVLVVGEWGGRSVKAETANSNGVEEMDRVENAYGFGRGAPGFEQEASAASPRRVFNLHFFVEARTPGEERELKRWQNRPGAKWVAFGALPPRAHGCKEAYSYVTGSGARERTEEKRGRKIWRGKRGNAADADADAAGRDSAGVVVPAGGGGGLMSYTRYGECPTWYGTGRMCGLDVQARRVHSFESLPKILRERVLRVDPDFDAGPPETMEECRLLAAQERGRREETRKRSWSLRRLLAPWGAARDL